MLCFSATALFLRISCLGRSLSGLVSHRGRPHRAAVWYPIEEDRIEKQAGELLRGKGHFLKSGF
jgi:hypothetical protein